MRSWRAALVVTGVVGPVLLGCAGLAAPTAGRGSVQVMDLRTEHRTDPIGIDEEHPLVSWKLESSGAPPPLGQAAYQIRVARSTAALRRGSAELWDSGRI